MTTWLACFCIKPRLIPSKAKRKKEKRRLHRSMLGQMSEAEYTGFTYKKQSFVKYSGKGGKRLSKGGVGGHSILKDKYVQQSHASDTATL